MLLLAVDPLLDFARYAFQCVHVGGQKSTVWTTLLWIASLGKCTVRGLKFRPLTKHLTKDAIQSKVVNFKHGSGTARSNAQKRSSPSSGGA